MKNKLAKVVEENNTTIYRVSRDLDIPLTTLAEWKNGKYIPRASTVKKVAKYFDISMEELV